jgi:hypothetical protein
VETVLNVIGLARAVLAFVAKRLDHDSRLARRHRFVFITLKENHGHDSRTAQWSG